MQVMQVQPLSLAFLQKGALDVRRDCPAFGAAARRGAQIVAAALALAGGPPAPCAGESSQPEKRRDGEGPGGKCVGNPEVPFAQRANSESSAVGPVLKFDHPHQEFVFDVSPYSVSGPCDNLPDIS